MPRLLQVMGTESFRIEVPDGAKVYLGPTVPKKENPLPEGAKITNLTLYAQEQEYSHGRDGSGAKYYTLHVEDADGSKLAMIPNVSGFRDLNINYTQKVATEEGATVWKSDNEGYKREETLRRQERWQKDDPPGLTHTVQPTTEKKKRGRA